jgi:nitrogen fixation/metabolism regulation signal transduction histidine kinase
LQRAFEPFFSNTPEGAGLGLSIARAVIERCAGDIWLENVADDAKKRETTREAQSDAAAAKALNKRDRALASASRCISRLRKSHHSSILPRRSHSRKI